MKKFEYMTRMADPMHRKDHPDAAEVVCVMDGRIQRIMGVFTTTNVAIEVASNLNTRTEFQIR